ncbi:MAG: carbon-nitrogen hydrolase family protein, partial [Actinobacteria bacterium]|nr:carbon-nitrogen hydrolase family protein [Actinomycetota bacterium]
MSENTNKLINIAICQMNIAPDKSVNLQKAESMIRKACKDNNSEIVVLPEMFNCPYNNSYFSRFSETYPGETTSMLSGLARELNIFLIGGSIPEKDGDRIFNTSFIFGRDGNMIARHRKVHLFDINIKNSISFKESRFISPGKDITVFDTDLCMIGVAICYDMRFPEFISKMSLLGAKLIIVPAAFNTITGPAHWHITARVRALDNQVYFACASPSRDTGGKYVAYGHSLIADPWGSVIAEACEEETILAATIDLSEVERIR